MADVSGPGGSPPAAHPQPPSTEAALEREWAAAHRVGWGFISLYTSAFASTSLLFLAPLLVTLALKVNSLVGIEQAPNSLSVVTGIGALLAMVGNPFFGKGALVSNEVLATALDYLPAGLSGVLASGTGERYSPEVAALLLGAWAIATLAVGAVTLHRRDP